MKIEITTLNLVNELNALSEKQERYIAGLLKDKNITNIFQTCTKRPGYGKPVYDWSNNMNQLVSKKLAGEIITELNNDSGCIEFTFKGKPAKKINVVSWITTLNEYKKLVMTNGNNTQ